MIVSTTHSIEGRRISSYLGVVVGEAVMGANIFRDLFASVRNIVGGRTASYEKELESARHAAFVDLQHRAAQLGANAVLGVDIDYEVISSGSGSMLMVSISGTAVKLG